MKIQYGIEYELPLREGDLRILRVPIAGRTIKVYILHVHCARIPVPVLRLELIVRKTGCFLLLVLQLVFLSEALPFQMHLVQLPRDEYEASLMMKEGSLDSTEWEMVKPYYAQPLNVPDGELRELGEIFSVPVRDLPLDAAHLDKYVPWAREDIHRFFIDYPELLPYRPILSFSCVKDRPVSHASLALYGDETRQATALSRFSLFGNSAVNVTGSASHLDTSVLWRRRTVQYSYQGVGMLRVGNFEEDRDDGLFYGYFSDTAKTTSAFDNWRYGMSRSFNGIFVQGAPWTGTEASAWYHKRPAETMAAFFCETRPLDPVRITVGLSHLTTSGTAGFAADSELYYHCGLDAGTAGWRARVTTGIVQRHVSSPPLYAEVSGKSGISSLDIVYSRTGDTRFVPRSRLAYACKAELGDDDSCRRELQMAKVSTRHAFSPRFSVSDELTYTTDDSTAAATASLSAAGSAAVDYRVVYSLRASSAGRVESHRTTLSLQRQMSRFVRQLFYGTVFVKNDGFCSGLLRVPVELQPLAGLTLTPYCSLYANTVQERSLSAGIRQSLYLFAKTGCDGEVEATVNNKNERGWYLHASAFFGF